MYNYIKLYVHIKWIITIHWPCYMICDMKIVPQDKEYCCTAVNLCLTCLPTIWGQAIKQYFLILDKYVSNNGYVNQMNFRVNPAKSFEELYGLHDTWIHANINPLHSMSKFKTFWHKVSCTIPGLCIWIYIHIGLQVRGKCIQIYASEEFSKGTFTMGIY